MKVVPVLLCGLFLSGCCKYRVASAKIEMHFVGFNPVMKSVKVVTVSYNNRYDTTILTLDANKRGVYTIDYSGSDSIFITGTNPNKVYSFRSLKTKTLNKGSGCGGPADEEQISFVFRDSLYSFASYHKVVVVP